MKCVNMGGIAVMVFLRAPCAAQSQQPYPEKPIRLIVGFTAGSEIDVIARLVSHEMSEKWGPRVVDNRPGAGSTLAAAIVAAAAPDGAFTD